MVGSFGIPEPGYLTDAIVRYDFENGDQLVALGTYATYPNTKICYNLISKDKTRILFTSDTITVPYKGFYKYTLPEPFHASDSLHIAVTYLNKEANDGHIIPIEMNHDNYTTITLGKEPQWVAEMQYESVELGLSETEEELPKEKRKMSKAEFKRAIGRLLKNKRIEIEETGIKLLD